MLEPWLASGSAVAADNTTMAPDFLAYVRDPVSGYISADLENEEGHELSLRL